MDERILRVVRATVSGLCGERLWVALGNEPYTPEVRVGVLEMSFQLLGGKPNMTGVLIERKEFYDAWNTAIRESTEAFPEEIRGPFLKTCTPDLFWSKIPLENKRIEEEA